MTAQSPKKVDARIVVETPEGADFQFVIAGPGVRVSAWLIDCILKYAVIIVAAILFATFAEANLMSTGASTGLLLAFVFGMDWFYGTLFECMWNGQTPGKRSAGLRVVRSNGTPIDLTCAAGRNFLRTADMLPVFYLVGMVSMLMTRRLQRLGDLVFDTMVIDERREWIGRAKGITDRVEPLLRSECRGRYSVPDRTLAVIERLFENDRIVSDARREEIARPLSDVLRARLAYEDQQPDPRNPHRYFQQQGNKHTQFLLRILKTFADDPTGVRGAVSKGTPEPRPDLRMAPPVISRSSPSNTSQRTHAIPNPLADSERGYSAGGRPS